MKTESVIVDSGHPLGVIAVIILVVVIAIAVSLYEKWVARIDPQAKNIIYGLCGFLAFAIIVLTILQMAGIVSGHPLWF